MYSFPKAVLLSGGHGTAIAEWHGGILYNHLSHFLKGCPPWWRRKLQWRVYIADYWSSAYSAIDNTARDSTYKLLSIHSENLMDYTEAILWIFAVNKGSNNSTRFYVFWINTLHKDFIQCQIKGRYNFKPPAFISFLWY
jgi:hypothetical protein